MESTPANRSQFVLASRPKGADNSQVTDVEEAMEGVEYGSEFVKTTDLTPEQKKVILEEYEVKAHYLGTGFDKIMELRGTDIPKGWIMAKPKPCVLAFRDGHEGEAVFVGPSIDWHKRDAQGKKVPAPLDRVQVRFNFDSQTPNIELTTRVDGTNPAGGDTVISGRITVENVEWSSPSGLKALVGGNTKTSQRDQAFRKSTEFPSTADWDELARLHQKGELYELLVFIKGSSKIHWTGLQDWAVQETTDRQAAANDSDVPTESAAYTATRDTIIQAFNRIVHFESPTVAFLMHVETAAVASTTEKLSYLGNLFELSRLGNFWFYRNHLDYVDEIKFQVRKEIVVPRWLVTVWQFKADYTRDDHVVYYDPRPYLWNGHLLPSQWPNSEEGAFLLKLGIHHERIRSTRNLKELCQSDIHVFRGQWEKVEGFDSQFIVWVYISNDARAHEANIKMPGTGTRIRIRVNPGDPESLNVRTADTFRGTVTSSPVKDDCTFMCVVNGPKAMKTGVLFPIFIDYVIDDVPYARQMKSVQEVQSITLKPSGVDLKALFFNDVLSAPEQDALAKMIDQARFLQLVKSAGTPNDMQLGAVLATASSSSGLTGIQGPPGTGKSLTVKLIARAMLGCGVRTLVCTSTNSAIKHLAQTFDEGSKAGKWLEESEYVMFSGAYSGIDAAERQKQQTATFESLRRSGDDDISAEDIAVMLDADNIIQEHARSVLVKEGNTPEHALTFGCKLKQAIDRWATSPISSPHPMVDKARQFLNMRSRLAYTDSAKRRELLNQVGVLEYNLGHYYLKHEVKAVFCTLSSSAHELLVSAFAPEELIIDEAAQESLPGLATPCGAFRDTIKHITLAGDHKQGKPIFAAATSNLGHSQISRNKFEETAVDKTGAHGFWRLTTSYRCLPQLLEFTKNFYPELEAAKGNEQMDLPLQRTLKAFWKKHARKNFKGSNFQVAIDVHGMHEKVEGSTTLFNLQEVHVLVNLLVALLDFSPPDNGRKIVPSDLVALTPYTGQVLAIRSVMQEQKDARLLQVRLVNVETSTVTHAQGLEWKIVLFSPVVGATERIKMDDELPIRFVANANSINVAMSRSCIGRYIIGNMNAMVQMTVDGHRTAKMFPAWFNHLKALSDQDNILTPEEWQYAMEHKAGPANVRPKEFSLRLQQPAPPLSKRKGAGDVNDGGDNDANLSKETGRYDNVGSRSYTGGPGNLPLPRANAPFSGDAQYGRPSKAPRNDRGGRGGAPFGGAGGAGGARGGGQTGRGGGGRGGASDGRGRGRGRGRGVGSRGGAVGGTPTAPPQFPASARAPAPAIPSVPDAPINWGDRGVPSNQVALAVIKALVKRDEDVVRGVRDLESKQDLIERVRREEEYAEAWGF